MSDQSTSVLKARRVRNALLATVFTVGLAGAAGLGATVVNGHVALAEPVRVEAATPADFTAVVESVRPAVVTVQVRTEVEDMAAQDVPQQFQDLPPDHPLFDFFEQFRERGGMDQFGERDGNGMRPFRPDRGMSQGSGFFISDDGYIVTNNHVVQDGSEVTVIMDDGTELTAEVIGTDERTDLALLKVEGSDFTYVRFADEQPMIGQWVIAVGNPFGLGGTVTAGIISAEGRDIGSGPYDNYLQIDAPVNNGNSGGPTFNTQGEVVGVNTAIYSPSGGNVGIAFAIPAATVGEVVDDLRDDGIVTRGWLGVRIQPVTADIAESLGVEGTDGAIVSEATVNSPADDAGIEAGDIITEVNGQADCRSEGAVRDDRAHGAGPADHRHGDAQRRRARDPGDAGQPERPRRSDGERRADPPERGRSSGLAGRPRHHGRAEPRWLLASWSRASRTTARRRRPASSRAT